MPELSRTTTQRGMVASNGSLSGSLPVVVYQWQSTSGGLPVVVYQ